jgi:hypothetical protein
MISSPVMGIFHVAPLRSGIVGATARRANGLLMSDALWCQRMSNEYSVCQDNAW